MKLVEKLNQYTENYWDFSGYRNKTPIVRYPAIMVAPMQECILKEIIGADTSIQMVLDPFCGSGTALVEGQKLGLNVFGFDINPLATLITQVRLEGVPDNDIEDRVNNLYSRLALLIGNVNPFYFRNINKWFREDIILSLSVIREAILAEPNVSIRRFFWCCFAETVKQFSNTRTSTFKLHTKTKEQIENLSDNTIEYFKAHIKKSYPEIKKQKNNNFGFVKCGDSKDLLRTIATNSVDLICTSPPYGDNHTTVTYGQFSILPLLWIEQTDLLVGDGSLFDTFSAIDTASLGGKINHRECMQPQYAAFLDGISLGKQKKILSFFKDYEIVFELLTKVLKPGKLLVMTLGNRRVDNQELRFDKFNDMLAEKYGMELYSTITRNIVGKRMPIKVSCLKEGGSVKSINKEYIKIYRKRV